jgi:hypothetical protein
VQIRITTLQPRDRQLESITEESSADYTTTLDPQLTSSCKHNVCRLVYATLFIKIHRVGAYSALLKNVYSCHFSIQ